MAGEPDVARRLTVQAFGPSPIDGNVWVADTIVRTERLCRVVPLVVLGIGVLLAALAWTIKDSVIGKVLTAAALVGVGFVFKYLAEDLVRLMRTGRYKRLARTLMARLSARESVGDNWMFWDQAVGALAVTPTGLLLLADRSTGYVPRALSPDMVLSAGVKTDATLVTDGETRGYEGFLGGVSTRTRAVTHSIGRSYLEMHYQLGANMPVLTAVVPFGGDRRKADATSAAIRHLRRIEVHEVVGRELSDR